MRRSSRATILRCFAVLVAAVAPARQARAFSTGICSTSFGNNDSTGCNQCHSGGTKPTVNVTADSTCLTVGESTTIHVTIKVANVNTGLQGGTGLNLRIKTGGGTLSVGGADSSKTKTICSGQITHTAPKDGVLASTVSFTATFTAPAKAGTTTLYAWGNSVNLNGGNTGDAAASDSVKITIAAAPDCGSDNCGTVTNGCGKSVKCGTCTSPKTCGGGGVANHCGCSPAAGACTGKSCGTVADGCGGTASCGTCPDGEICNASDKCTCSGVPNATCGIGECANTGTSCLASSCTPKAPTDEVCDGLDNDCDGDVDDGLPLSSCGVGACAAFGTSCDAASCTPGAPSAELCDGVDEDCNGVVDDGALCPAGQSCVGGVCQSCTDGECEAGTTDDAGADDAGANDAGANDAGADDAITPSDATAEETGAADAIAMDAGDDASTSVDADGGSDGGAGSQGGCGCRTERSGDAPSSAIGAIVAGLALAASRRRRR